jgi:hypothetical protein
MSDRYYYVTTWDTYREDFTPQQGVRTGPYSLFGLRGAIRKLQDMGYPVWGNDSAVYITSVDKPCR